MAVALNEAFIASPDVVFRDLDGESVLLNLATGTYFGLNATGTRMWQLIETHRVLEHVLAALSDEFDAPRSQLQTHLLDLVSQLESKGLLARDSR
jgi:hypothetical protein